MSETRTDRLSPIILGASPTHAERSRTLVALQGQGTLCTLLASHARSAPPRGHDEAPPPDPRLLEADGVDPLGGFPYGSVVSYALDPQGAPLFLVSSLAEHTRNFLADPRASLLVHEAADGRNPLALGRVTLLGEIVRTEAAEARTRYLERHPEAAYHVDFRDFAFYRLCVQAIRYIGGFGRMSWTSPEAYAQAEADPTARFAPRAVRHMNEDHADSLVLLAQRAADLPEVTQVELKAIDYLGFEMTASTPQGPRFVRLGFPTPVRTPEAMREAFVAMVATFRSPSLG